MPVSQKSSYTELCNHHIEGVTIVEYHQLYLYNTVLLSDSSPFLTMDRGLGACVQVMGWFVVNDVSSRNIYTRSCNHPFLGYLATIIQAGLCSELSIIKSSSTVMTVAEVYEDS